MDIRSRFEQLQPRERALILTAAGLALLTAVVTLGIRPLTESSRRTVEQIAEKEALLAELERVAGRLGPQAVSDSSADEAGNQSLVVLVDRTTRGRGLGPYLKRNEPDGATSIRLRFENAPFDVLLEWLAEMQNAHSVMTLNAGIDPGQDPGRVNCSLQLSRAPGA